MLPNLPDDDQIHAHNLTGPAEKDLLCHKPALKVLSACSHEIPKAVPRGTRTMSEIISGCSDVSTYSHRLVA